MIYLTWMSFFISNQARSINFVKKGVWRNNGEGVGVYIAQKVLEEIRSIFWLHICICKIKKVVVFKNVVREYFVQNFFKEYAYFSLRMMSFFQKSVVEVEVVGGGGCNMYMYVPTEIAIYMPNVFFNFWNSHYMETRIVKTIKCDRKNQETRPSHGLLWDEPGVILAYMYSVIILTCANQIQIC